MLSNNPSIYCEIQVFLQKKIFKPSEIWKHLSLSKFKYTKVYNQAVGFCPAFSLKSKKSKKNLRKTQTKTF